jgi:4-amino-4-deoxy-L-arabinose transferase-like glycosyltransferase
MSPGSSAAGPRFESILAAIRRIDLALALILAVGLWLRWQYVHLPMAEAHSWRQVTNLDIARNFAEGSRNIFYPRVSWGGPGDASVGMEFPLLQWIAGLLFHLSGNPELMGRLLSILFSLAAVAAMYGLGARLFGKPCGRAAAFLLAVSPSFVFFGRTFISDTPMVFFSIAGIWGLVTYAETHDRRAAIWGTVSTALACLVKIPAVLILGPIAWCAWKDRRWKAAGDPVWLGAIAVPVIVTALWYWHADVLFHRTGLGQAIWHPSGGYAPDIAAAAGPIMGVSHWSTVHQLKDPHFYQTLLDRTWMIHLTPPGLAVVLFGIASAWGRRGSAVVYVWMAAVVALILASAEGNRWHEFHQLPGLPPAALFFGLAAAPAFDGRWLRERTGSRLAPFASGACVLIVALLGFRYSQVVDVFFRPDHLDLVTIKAGQAIERAVPRGGTLVVVEYAQYGANSPILLYRAHRKGWSFDLSSITPRVIELLHREYSAHYFATTIWSELQARHPDVVEYLRGQQRIELDVPNAALFVLK